MQLSIFSGTANRPLAERVCEALDGVPLGRALVSRFSNGEPRVQIEESVRERDVYIIQPTCAGLDGSSVNDNFMQLLVMVDALDRAGAGRITAVVPSFGYARQDRRAETRTPITAKLAADAMAMAGVKRVVTIDLHAEQIEGMFPRGVHVENIYASHAMEGYLRREYEGVMCVSPDAGGAKRNRAYAKLLNSRTAMIDKRRDEPGKVGGAEVVGDVDSKRCLITDDMIDSAGTLVAAGHSLMKAGAVSVDAVATHPVFSGNAVENIATSPFGRIIVADTIPISDAMMATGKIHIVSVGGILADAIRRLHNGDTLHPYLRRS